MSLIRINPDHQDALYDAIELARRDRRRDLQAEPWLGACPICDAGLEVVIDGDRYELEGAGFDLAPDDTPLDQARVECRECAFVCSLEDVQVAPMPQTPKPVATARPPHAAELAMYAGAATVAGPDDSRPDRTCRECGGPVCVGPCEHDISVGVSHHITGDGAIDHDREAIHTAIVHYADEG